MKYLRDQSIVLIAEGWLFKMWINLKDIENWAYNSMEGADEPEFTLYNDILFSIRKYEWSRRNYDFYVKSGMVDEDKKFWSKDFENEEDYPPPF